MSVKPDPNYDFIPPLQETSTTKRGTQCGECGMKFEYGMNYGYYCGNHRCPTQIKPTYARATTLCSGTTTL